MAIRTIEVNGVEYQIDYDGLANNPIPSCESAGAGDVLAVNDNGEAEWTPVVGGMLPSWDASYGDTTMMLGVSDAGLEWKTFDEILPAYGSEGRYFLTANEGYLGWEEVIPPTGSVEDGAILRAHESDIVSWDELNGVLPSWDSSDNGKVLGIYDGHLEWVTP